MLGRLKWESVEDFRPPNNSLKHVPKSEHKALARAVAQRKNNALTALRGSSSLALTTRQHYARSHELEILFTYTKVPTSAVKRNTISKSTGKYPSASAIENLPIGLKQKIFGEITLVDRLSLALSSSKMMQTANLFYDLDEDDWDHPTVWYLELMQRLQDWMPKEMVFCHHCMIYLPGHSFGPSRSAISDLICMDCRFNSPLNLRSGLRICQQCDGCLIMETVVEGLLEAYPALRADQVWDQINDENIEGTSDLERLMPFYPH